MANTFGHLYRVTTWGESHGGGVGAVIDGCPPQIPLVEADIQPDLDRRRPGQSKIVTPRKEADRCEILSGVFGGKTLGTPISVWVRNEDARPEAYKEMETMYRPSHADYTYQQKYGFRDYRGGGRSSARETVMRVAAGAIARKYLATRLGIEIHGYLSQIGSLVLDPVAPETAYDNPFFCPDPSRVKELEDLIWKMREEGDSIGARITVIAKGVPPGLGEPVFDRLDADLAYAMMGINAVKAVEVGAGVNVVAQRGSEHRDELTPTGFTSNNAGGVLGGISSGQDIIVHASLKPTSSIQVPGRTITVDGTPTEIITTGRHDPCVGIRATPIAEAMMAIVLMDHWLRHRAQNGDVQSTTPVITQTEKKR